MFNCLKMLRSLFIIPFRNNIKLKESNYGIYRHFYSDLVKTGIEIKTTDENLNSVFTENIFDNVDSQNADSIQINSESTQPTISVNLTHQLTLGNSVKPTESVKLDFIVRFGKYNGKLFSELLKDVEYVSEIVKTVETNTSIENLKNAHMLRCYDSIKSKTQYLYVLELENDKFYVGRTGNLQMRLQNHKFGMGAKWTKKYPVIEIIYQSVLLNDYDEDEDNLTFYCMRRSGIENVRGGKMCYINFTDSNIKRINNILEHISLDHNIDDICAIRRFFKIKGRKNNIPDLKILRTQYLDQHYQFYSTH